MEKTIIKPGKMIREQGQRKIHISGLQIGMFISKLDREWLDTPFLIQGFTVESQEDINIVEQYCEHVWIDAVKETYVPPEERAAHKTSTRKKHYINKVTASNEHVQAVGLIRESRRITKNLLDEARLGSSINTEQAKSTVTDCVQSILRNADALLWLSKIRNEDEYTAEHSLNVCILSIAFGRHIGLEEEELHKIGLCGLLHDVGKMKIPPEVLNKPDRLTDKEFKMIKAHTVHGRNLLMTSSGGYQGVVDVAYSHHERMDGNGYPRGIKASGVTDFSRIIAVVDAYDAMTAQRCYAAAIPSTDALREIYRCRGTQFDERIATQFVEMIGIYPPGSIVELVNGCVGIVLNTNYRHRHLPKVLIVRDQDKSESKEKIVNLADTANNKLEKSFHIKKVHVDGVWDISLKTYKDKGLQLSFD